MIFDDKNNNSSNLDIIRKKMNEDMETKIIYTTYRKTVCMIMESKKKKFSMINFENAFVDFNKPHILDEFTDEQAEMIKKMKTELYELAKLFGYCI